MELKSFLIGCAAGAAGVIGAAYLVDKFSDSSYSSSSSLGYDDDDEVSLDEKETKTLSDSPDTKSLGDSDTQKEVFEESKDKDSTVIETKSNDLAGSIANAIEKVLKNKTKEGDLNNA